MVALLLNILLIFIFFFSGYVVQAVKKLISVSTDWFLKLLNLLGVRFKSREETLCMSEEFKNTYKEIKIVKLSKKNIKQQSSIDWVWFSIFAVSALLLILNFGSNMISNGLFKLIESWKLVKTAADMNTFFTATIFSAISFAVSKLLQRWNETKQQRIEAKEAKIKMKALAIMSSKELLTEAKKKDADKYSQLKE